MPKKLSKTRFVFLLCVSLLGPSACLRDGGKNKSTENTETEIPRPANGDELAEVIKGLWINLSDPAERIEFVDTLMKRYAGASPAAFCRLDIQADCADVGCTTNDERIVGWCFVARCPDQRNCYRVLKVAADTLYLMTDPASGRVAKYVRSVSPP
ncbi:MAG: hypothetical protein ACK4NS_07330 [Saprospiraceae bacterium]